MDGQHPRIIREKKTIDAMIRIYCIDHHKGGGELCQDCSELLQYAIQRLDKCPFQEKKATCKYCPVHCYKEPTRTQIKEVMRYSGPKMIFKHPILAIYHVLDEYKSKKR